MKVLIRIIYIYNNVALNFKGKNKVYKTKSQQKKRIIIVKIHEEKFRLPYEYLQLVFPKLCCVMIFFIGTSYTLNRYFYQRPVLLIPINILFNIIYVCDFGSITLID